MSVEIKYKGLWTYNVTIPSKERKELERKAPISYLNEKEYTHIHGELQIIINGKIVPKLGIDSIDDVCFGYWIEMLVNLFNAFKRDVQTYTIEGGEQGKPAYKFDKECDICYLSIVDSILGGKKDSNWQRVQFKFTEFIAEFNRFKKEFLSEIGSKAPNMFDYWNKKFLL